MRHGDEGLDELPILDDFLEPVRDAGGGVHLKNLYNDYVYFWRWALWKVFDSTEDAGIVTFITASSYLRGPAFAGMRRKMREVFDELWIIDLEGDSLGARKTENVFAIRTPVAIAIGVRAGSPRPEYPARVRKVRLSGAEPEKLAQLAAAQAFAALDWQECSSDWDAPFYPAVNGGYSTLPLVTAIFPWQHSGAQLKRTWPIGENRAVLAARWRALIERPLPDRRTAFRETRDRKVDRRYPPLVDGDERDPPITALDPTSPLPPVVRYAYRSFDRQYVLADSRVGDRIRTDLWRAHGNQQIYMISFLTHVLGSWPRGDGYLAHPGLGPLPGFFRCQACYPAVAERGGDAAQRHRGTALPDRRRTRCVRFAGTPVCLRLRRAGTAGLRRAFLGRA